MPNRWSISLLDSAVVGSSRMSSFASAYSARHISRSCFSLVLSSLTIALGSMSTPRSSKSSFVRATCSLRRSRPSFPVSSRQRKMLSATVRSFITFSS